MDDIRNLETLRGRRWTWDTHWQEIADYILPRKSDFTVQRFPGQKRTEKIFDGTAPWALDQLASGLDGLMTSQALPWFELGLDDPDLEGQYDVSIWLQDTARRMMSVFNDRSTNFNSQKHELYLDLCAFGTGVMYVADEGNIRFSTRYLGECYIEENGYGLVDTVYRVFTLPRRDAEQRFDKLPKPDKPKPYEPVELLHVVKPRTDRDERKKNSQNKPYASRYWDLKEKKLLSESGYDDFPYMVPRWSKSSREVYGRSPSFIALPDIKMVNQMAKTTLTAAQKVVDPPLQLPDDGFVMPIRTNPGGINYYRAGTQDRIEPMALGARPDIGEEMLDKRRQAISRAFYVDLLNLPGQQQPGGQNPYMTATEVLQRREEKMRILGPTVTRLQHEFLGPLIHRVFGLMWRKGMLAPPPAQIQGANLEPRYISPIAKAQEASTGESIMRWMQLLGPFAQADPSIFEMVDANELARTAAQMYGVPERILKSPEEVAKAQAAAQQQQELAQNADIAQKETLSMQQAAKANAALAKTGQ